MYTIKTIGLSVETKRAIRKWLSSRASTVHWNDAKIQHNHIDLFVIQIHTAFDWIKIYRWKKNFPSSKFIVLTRENLMHTTPIAVRLKIDALLLLPLKKHALLRAFDEAFVDLTTVSTAQKHLLFKLLLQDISSAEQLHSFQKQAQLQHIPNIVCIMHENGTKARGQSLQALLKHKLYDWGKEVTFLTSKHKFIILFYTPYVYKSIKEWEELQYYLLKLINEVKSERNIQLQAGVSAVNSNPLELHTQYLEAKQALQTAFENNQELCFYEDIALDEPLQKCIEYISSHYNEEISIKTVASKVHLSHTYFSKLFKKEFGVSFIEYVTNVRIKRAKWLLSNTNDSIESIAAQVGFKTPNYFSSIFKKFVGQSPSEYREHHLIHAY